jgi:hypothetical protein
MVLAFSTNQNKPKSNVTCKRSTLALKQKNPKKESKEDEEK